MREILFRGKRVDNGDWIYGYYFKATHHWHNHGIHEDWIATDTVQNGGWCNVRGKYAVLAETAGQYTGLTDKNGTKIFEGDIVLWCGIKGIVVWEGHKFYVKSNLLWDFSDDDCIEVIGNIHDNRLLLKGE